MTIPNYLLDFKELFEKNPREANLQWFNDANYGLFLHYGLYSALKKHEWVMFKQRIHVKEYEKLKENFTAEGFDAKSYVDLAKAAGMNYINITTRHHDSFCLWDTQYSDFNSMNSPAKRDLIKELYEACEEGGIALFLYYSHGMDWRHPHSATPDMHRVARPHYRWWSREKTYVKKKDHDLNIYIQFMYNQVKELLEKFPNIGGIWLDGIIVPWHNRGQFKVQELYDMIHEVSPHALVCFKQGLLGTEDFHTSEIRIPTEKSSEFKKGKIVEFPEKKVEVCTIMTIKPGSWGYYEGGKHRDVGNVVELYNDVVAKGANLLLNTGPLPDGSIDPIDDKILREAGKVIQSQ